MNVTGFLSSSSLLPCATAVTLLLTGCGTSLTAVPSGSPSAAKAPRTGAIPADPFSRVLVLGDSLSAGFQNASLLGTQQVNGWASLVAQQAHFSMPLPLVASPGIPNVYSLVQASLPPVLAQAPGATIGRVNPTLVVNDLAVPGFKVHDMLNTAPVASPSNPVEQLTSYVLGYPAGTTGTEVQQAIARKPSTIFLMIGANDVLGVDGSGNLATATSLSSFTADFTELMTTLATNTTAHLIVGNIPDVTAIPYMTPASQLLEECQEYTGVPSSFFIPILNIHPGDLVNWAGVADFHADALRAQAGEMPTPLPARDILTAADVATLQAQINSMNQVIAQQVAAAGGTLVDVHALLADWSANGATINGYQASMGYLGGLFGVDGIHPSNTGYALLANQFIASTNAALGTNIPAVDVAAVAAKDPYFGANRTNDYLPYVRQHITPEAGKAADGLIFGWKNSKGQ